MCNGDNSTCVDCLGAINGTALIDACGDCRTGPSDLLFNSACTDCFAVLFGNATVDACGDCRYIDDPLRNLNCTGCDGIVNSGFENDLCGDCRNGTSDPLYNSACLDCFGVPNGPAVLDHCGVCNGNDLSCIAGLCYVDSLHPNVDVPGSLRYSYMQTALTQCVNHPGVIVVDTGGAPTLGTFSITTPVSGFRIEAQTTAEIVGDMHTFNGDNLTISGFTWRRPATGSTPIATITSCNCVTFTGHTINGALTTGTGTGISLVVNCLPLPAAPPTGCTSRIETIAIDNFDASTQTTALLGTFNTALKVDGVSAGNVHGRALHILQTDHDLGVDNLSATMCGSSASPCFAFSGNTIGFGRQPSASFASVQHTGINAFSGGGILSAALAIDLVSMTSPAGLSGVFTNGLDTGVRLNSIPSFPSGGDIYEQQEWLRLFWLSNRLPDDMDGASSDIVYNTLVCNDGCSFPLQTTFQRGATAPAIPVVFGFDSYADTDRVFVNMSLVTNDPSRFELVPLYIFACDPDEGLPAPYDPNAFASTGCFAPTVGATEKHTLFDWVLLGGIPDHALIAPLFHTQPSPHETVFSFNGNVLLSLQRDQTLQIVYNVVDLVDSRVYSLATAPLDMTILNPSQAHSARFTFACPVGQGPLPGSSNPITCVDLALIPGATPPVGGGGGGDDGGGTSPLIWVLVGVAFILLAGCFAFGGTRRRRGKPAVADDDKKKKKKDKEDDMKKSLLDEDDKEKKLTPQEITKRAFERRVAAEQAQSYMRAIGSRNRGPKI